MGVWEILLLAVALSMDACAVAMTNGMSYPKTNFPRAVLIGGFFGFFQFLMPLIGYFITGVIADAFLSTFKSISGWVSFVLLAFLGGKMLLESIRELRCKNKETKGACTCSSPLSIGKLTLQSIATSIDALAVGVTLQMAAITDGLAFGGVWGATLVIGCVTFILSVAAVHIGKAIGNKLADKAGIFGGVVLLAIGIKILIESLL